ncbi:phosphatidylinositide phosphatase SAC2 isoform X1 [Cotesia glomerata]|uniref:phosphatidylinositide phosphatase SAC2 isoform X1 n=1 Tax=Cotesia glomerata TaxID=32391 RepID=UPI001D006275|nr:phosphatidylinositide phosphatase SAC2 isoform X1 [Cotesia glomerata]XP_044583409.1 phosphatidylinositide phosphatase SAC2 isoform X1 [Cotesia glomerata]
MMPYELFRCDTHFIFVKEQHSLWCEKNSGEFSVKSDWEWASANNLECLGIFYGIIGKIDQTSFMESKLMLIKDVSNVGELYGNHVIYKIKSVAFLELGSKNANINLLPCKKHNNSSINNKALGRFLDDAQKTGFAKTWGSIKSATNTIKNTTQQAATLATSQVKSTMIRRNGKDKEKLEKRLLDELTKVFSETDSFFFCETGDLTNSLQRRKNNTELLSDKNQPPLWKTVDDRFFWNKYMLRDIINLNNELADQWILPIIQGYVQIEKCQVETGFDHQPIFETFHLAIISRRSRFRAGTRYKRRGVDDDGKCANYVETEQLVWYHDHQVSFVQVRGSVPVYWSQPGYKYKPPPRIDRGEAETQVAFEKHFAEEIACYGPVCIVNLTEQSGKEKIIWDAYCDHVIKYNSPDIIYTTFDFHEYCRGMHFENVTILINALSDILGEMGYCWRDSHGSICSQQGVFRINCIDCLDRTNVVQTAIGKTVMEMQFSKLGLIPPDGTLPSNIRQTFQSLWANNGDIISKQYAGTNALKGDYTRTGERKFTGLMKDGVNSANRYYQQHFLDETYQAAIDITLGNPIDIEKLKTSYLHSLHILDNCCVELIPVKPPNIELQFLNHSEILLATNIYTFMRYYLNRFKDLYRQASIDLMLGKTVSEEIFQERTEEEDNAATAIHVKLLIEDCKKLLISNSEAILGSWGLIDADPVTGNPNETEMDTILILTKDSYYIADYDDQIDKVTNYQRVLLSEIEMIEFGQPEISTSFFKNKQHHCIRINYCVNNESGYYHMFRCTNLRFFNNMAVVIKTDEEAVESLRAICEAFSVAIEIAALPEIPVIMNTSLVKKISKQIETKGSTGLLDISSFPQLTRNTSESQLHALKNAGTKAFNNMSEQFSKLNKLSNSFSNARKLSINHPDKKTSSDKIEQNTQSKVVFTIDRCEPGIEAENYDFDTHSYDDSHENFEEDSSKVESVISSLENNSSNPKITILNTDGQEKDEKEKIVPPSTLNLVKKISHSSSEVDGDIDSRNFIEVDKNGEIKSTSLEEGLPKNNITSSQSESALKSIKSNITNVTSPVATTAKEILSPFSKFAKGVQTFGANLDPRKLKSHQGTVSKNLSDHHLDQREKLIERWKDCKSMLIAL